MSELQGVGIKFKDEETGNYLNLKTLDPTLTNSIQIEIPEKNGKVALVEDINKLDSELRNGQVTVAKATSAQVAGELADPTEAGVCKTDLSNVDIENIPAPVKEALGGGSAGGGSTGGLEEGQVLLKKGMNLRIEIKDDSSTPGEIVISETGEVRIGCLQQGIDFLNHKLIPAGGFADVYIYLSLKETKEEAVCLLNKDFSHLDFTINIELAGTKPDSIEVPQQVKDYVSGFGEFHLKDTVESLNSDSLGMITFVKCRNIKIRGVYSSFNNKRTSSSERNPLFSFVDSEVNFHGSVSCENASEAGFNFTNSKAVFDLRRAYSKIFDFYHRMITATDSDISIKLPRYVFDGVIKVSATVPPPLIKAELIVLDNSKLTIDSPDDKNYSHTDMYDPFIEFWAIKYIKALALKNNSVFKANKPIKLIYPEGVSYGAKDVILIESGSKVELEGMELSEPSPGYLYGSDLGSIFKVNKGKLVLKGQYKVSMELTGVIEGPLIVAYESHLECRYSNLITNNISKFVEDTFRRSIEGPDNVHGISPNTGNMDQNGNIILGNWYGVDYN